MPDLEQMLLGGEEDTTEVPENDEVTEEIVTETEEKTTEEETEDSVDDETKEEEKDNEKDKEIEPKGDYQPNFKYKVKGEEKEIDDRLKSIIKDKESEAYVRDLVEKAEGISHIKEHRDRLENTIKEYKPKVEEYEKIAPEHKHFQGLVRDSAELIKHGDVLGGLNKLGITEELIAEAYRIIESPPEERGMYNYTSALAQEKLKTSKELELQKTQIQQEQSRASEMALANLKAEINLGMSNPDYTDVIHAYNKRMGNDDAFLDEIYAIGNTYASSGNILAGKDAVKLAYEKVSKLIGNTTEQVNKTTDKIVKKTKDTGIPSVKSNGTTGAKKYNNVFDMMKDIE